MSIIFYFEGEESQDEGCPELLPDNKEKLPSKKLDEKKLLEKDSSSLLNEKEFSDGNTIQSKFLTGQTNFSFSS